MCKKMYEAIQGRVDMTHKIIHFFIFSNKFTSLHIAWYGECGKGSANVLILVATH